MLRRVYRLWQTWVTAFACVMAVGYATVAQDDAGSTPKPDAEQETAAPAEPQDDAPAVVLTLPFSITMAYLNASSEGLGPGQEKRPAKLVITG